jgi:hypothetical protein
MYQRRSRPAHCKHMHSVLQLRTPPCAETVASLVRLGPLRSCWAHRWPLHQHLRPLLWQHQRSLAPCEEARGAAALAVGPAGHSYVDCMRICVRVVAWMDDSKPAWLAEGA